MGDTLFAWRLYEKHCIFGIGGWGSFGRYNKNSDTGKLIRDDLELERPWAASTCNVQRYSRTLFLLFDH